MPRVLGIVAVGALTIAAGYAFGLVGIVVVVGLAFAAERLVKRRQQS